MAEIEPLHLGRIQQPAIVFLHEDRKRHDRFGVVARYHCEKRGQRLDLQLNAGLHPVGLELVIEIDALRMQARRREQVLVPEVLEFHRCGRAADLRADEKQRLVPDWEAVELDAVFRFGRDGECQFA